MPDEPTRLTKTEARAGSGGTQVRTVMIVSLVLVVALFVGIYLIYR